MPINTAHNSERFRAKTIDLTARKLLITNLRGTLQEKDLTEPCNCEGFGRIRHFRRKTSPGWPPNGLPIDPACRALGLDATDMLRAQAFQNAACNWRCWYCFVPYDLLNADMKHAAWLEPRQLVDLYLDQTDPPQVLDLTGGEPSLVPEWVVWMMQELMTRGLEKDVYLWSDDNLSNDYFWDMLSDSDRDLIMTYPAHGRVGCFKGYNRESFAFNTGAEPEAYDLQFARMSRLAKLGLDVYGYVTFTTPTVSGVQKDIRDFCDRLQSIDPSFPMRTVPLEIRPFTPIQGRLNVLRESALQNQQVLIAAWREELERRFTAAQLSLPINAVALKGKR